MARPHRRIAVSIAVACAALACGDSAPAPVPPAPVPELPAPVPPPAPTPTPIPAPPEAAPLPEEAAPPPGPSSESAPPADAAISLEDLGRQIKETSAIGMFTKLALKNDIDDLVDALRGYHDRGQGRLDPLRERYEALVLKLLALLEKDEPGLALALARSREDIWNRLADPVEFAQLSS